MKKILTPKKKIVKFNISKSELKSIYQDYSFNTEDVLNYDDETKDILDKFKFNLTAPEQIILELYAEFHSQRKVAQLLNVSRTSIVKELNKIRKKIIDA